MESMIVVNLGKLVFEVPELYAAIYIAMLGAVAYILVNYLKDRLVDLQEWFVRILLGAIVGYLSVFLPPIGGITGPVWAFVLGFAGPAALKLIIDGSGVIKSSVADRFGGTHYAKKKH